MDYLQLKGAISLTASILTIMSYFNFKMTCEKQKKRKIINKKLDEINDENLKIYYHNEYARIQNETNMNFGNTYPDHSRRLRALEMGETYLIKHLNRIDKSDLSNLHSYRNFLNDILLEKKWISIGMDKPEFYFYSIESLKKDISKLIDLKKPADNDKVHNIMSTLQNVKTSVKERKDEAYKCRKERMPMKKYIDPTPLENELNNLKPMTVKMYQFITQVK